MDPTLNYYYFYMIFKGRVASDFHKLITILNPTFDLDNNCLMIIKQPVYGSMEFIHASTVGLDSHAPWYFDITWHKS